MTGHASTSRVRALWRILSGATLRDLDALIARQNAQIDHAERLLARIEEWQLGPRDA